MAKEENIFVNLDFKHSNIGTETYWGYAIVGDDGAYMERNSRNSLLKGAGDPHPTLDFMIKANGNNFVPIGNAVLEWRLEDQYNNNETIDAFKAHMNNTYSWAGLTWSGPTDGVLKLESSTLDVSDYTTWQNLPFQDYSFRNNHSRFGLKPGAVVWCAIHKGGNAGPWANMFRDLGAGVTETFTKEGEASWFVFSGPVQGPDGQIEPHTPTIVETSLTVTNAGSESIRVMRASKASS
jgi:hypothetical protein